MTRFFQYIFLPVLFANMTLAQNGWLIGRFLFWAALLIAALVLVKNKKLLLGISLILWLVAFKVLRILYPELVILTVFSKLGEFFLFSLAGFFLYANDLRMLRNVLVALVFGNLVLMPFQIAGVSSALMYWNTDYAHDLNVLALEEVGTFKEIPVYPTFLLNADSIYFQIGQGRPTGITPANNLLSVFLTFAFLIFFHSPEMKRSAPTNLLITASLVLSGSKFAILFAVMIYLRHFLSLDKRVTLHAFGGLATLLYLFIIYCLMFPGIANGSFGSNAFFFSFGFRLLDIFLAIGVPADFLELTNHSFFHDMRESSSGSAATLIGFLVYGTPAIILLAIGLIVAVVLRKRIGLLSRKQHRELMFDLMLWGVLAMVIFPAVIQSILFFALSGVIYRSLSAASDSHPPNQPKA